MGNDRTDKVPYLITRALETRLSRRSTLKLFGASAAALAAARYGSLAVSAQSPMSTIYGDLYPDLPRGGHAVVGVPGQVPTTLDPLASPAFATFHSADPAHDWLEHFDTNGDLVPSLAESVEIVDDVTLMYVIHEGATFHNGRAVTADDVRQTFEWIQDPANGSGVASRIAGVTVEAVDDRTAVLHLDEPNAGLRSNLTRVPIVPVEDADKQAESPVGAGPYRFKEFVRDAFVDYEANPDYWNPDAPRLDTLRVAFFPDTTSGSQAFLAGQMDYNHEVPLPEVPAYQSRVDAGEFGAQITERGWVYIVFNHTRPPWDNNLVRQAVRLVVDRDAMADAPYNGIARPLWFAGIAPENPLYPKELEYPRDVDAAKAMLTEAGFPDGFDDTMLTLDFNYYQGVNTIAQANLAEIGINVNLEVVDIATLIDRTFTNSDFGISSLGDSLDPEPSAQVDPYFSTTGGNNYLNYSNPAADELMVAARSTFDEATRKELYHDVFKTVFIDDVAAIPVTSEPYFTAFTNTFNGAQFGPAPNSRLHYPIASQTG